MEYVESYLRRWRDTTHIDHIMGCKVSLQWSILIGSGGKWFVSNDVSTYGVHALGTQPAIFLMYVKKLTM